MSLTLSDYKDRVGERTHHTGAEYLDLVTKFINEGKNRVISIFRGQYDWLRDQATLSFSVGEYRKEILSTLNFESFDDPDAVYDETVNKSFLTGKDWADFKRTATWKPTTSAPTTADYGTPSFYSTTYLVDSGAHKHYLYLDVPTDTAMVLRIFFFRKLPDLVNNSDTFLGMPPNFEYMLEQYAVWRASEFREYNNSVSENAKKEWEEFVLELTIASNKTFNYTKKIRTNNPYR